MTPKIKMMTSSIFFFVLIVSICSANKLVGDLTGDFFNNEEIKQQLIELQQQFEANLTIINENFQENSEKLEELQENLDLVNQDLKELIDQFTNGTHTCVNDWETYSDTKCFKVLNKTVSVSEAKKYCTQLDSSSTLVSILNENEQIFLQNLLSNYTYISDNAWIGLELKNGTYKWVDANKFTFKNWDENADKKDICVQMSLGRASLGKWRDESCDKKYLGICQMKQSTQTVIRQELEKLTKTVDKQQKKLKQQQKEIDSIKEVINQTEVNNTVPLGFIYVQLPWQSTPRDLWLDTTWTEVTSSYSGLFFRAGGGSSMPFERIQEANTTSITDMLTSCIEGVSYTKQVGPKHYSITDGKWNAGVCGEALYNMKLYKSKGEIRPRNTAVKIWKRTA